MSIKDMKGALKPILKYPGGKRWISPGIKYLFRSTGTARFIEPFAGGLSVSFYLGCPSTILGDKSPHVINFYQSIKNGMLFDLEWDDTEEYYYAARDRFNEINKRKDYGGEEAAKLFYFLNRAGYNGLNRWSKKTGFNVPKGSHDNLVYRENFDEYISLLNTWDMRIGDFDSILSELQEGDFLYLDPPYVGTFDNYSAEGFKWEDQVRLIDAIKDFKGPVVISNSWNSKVVNLYREAGFICNRVAVRRSISRGKRKIAYEVVAFRGVGEYQRSRFREHVGLKRFDKAA